MVLRKKHAQAAQHKAKLQEDGEESEANQGSDIPSSGFTLDEYFNSKKDYQLQQMKEKTELLEKEIAKRNQANNEKAMVMDKYASNKKHRDEDLENGEESPIDNAAEVENPYEDDYEPLEQSASEEESSTTQNSVAGLTLSDYLTGKPDIDNFKQKLVKYDKLIKAKNAIAPPKQPDISSIQGMSLDSYLGASNSTEDDVAHEGKVLYQCHIMSMHLIFFIIQQKGLLQRS